MIKKDITNCYKTSVVKYIVFVSAIFYFYSCKTTEAVHKDRILWPMRGKKICSNVEEYKLNFNSIAVKFTASMNDSASDTKFNGIFRIKKDSIIWVSIRPLLGIELARVVLTPDSVKFTNKLNSTYYSGDYEFISNKFKVDFDFYKIQALLTNELFFYPEDPDSLFKIREFKSTIDSGCYCIQSINDRKVDRYLVLSLQE